MTSNINFAGNVMGAVTRVGNTQDGRAVYQLSNPNGEVANISIAQKDCDKFEKSFNEMMRLTPELQKYAEQGGQEKMAKRKKASRWVVGGSTVAGLALPIILTRKAKVGKQILWAILGTVTGFVGGAFAASKMVIPAELKKFAKVQKELSTIDIQPVQIGVNPQSISTQGYTSQEQITPPQYANTPAAQPEAYSTQGQTTVQYNTGMVPQQTTQQGMAPQGMVQQQYPQQSSMMTTPPVNQGQYY